MHKKGIFLNCHNVIFQCSPESTLTNCGFFHRSTFWTKLLGNSTKYICNQVLTKQGDNFGGHYWENRSSHETKTLLISVNPNLTLNTESLFSEDILWGKGRGRKLKCHGEEERKTGKQRGLEEWEEQHLNQGSYTEKKITLVHFKLFLRTILSL